MGRRFLNRRHFKIGGLALVAAALALALLALALIRFGYVDRWFVARLQETLEGYGARAEIGSLRASLRGLEVEARDVKIYVEGATEPFATLDRLTAEVTLHYLFGIGGEREVRLRSLALDGLRARYLIDQEGRSNLAGLHLPPPRERPFVFNYSVANVTLTDAEIYYVDRPHRLDARARDLDLTLQPMEGEDRIRLVATSKGSELNFDGRTAAGIDLALTALGDRRGADVESLTVRSPLMNADLKGRLTNWVDFGYQFETRAEIKMPELAALLAPDLNLRGTSRFEGRVEGQGLNYAVNGRIRSDDLIARGIRLGGLDLNTAGEGEGQSYRARTELALARLEAAGFRVNRFTAIGQITGVGDGFAWEGDLRAGAAAGRGLTATNIALRGARINGQLNDLSPLTVSGRMAIGSLVTSDIPVGNLTGEVVITPEEANVPRFSGEIFGGQAAGSARLRFDRGASSLAADLSGIDLDRALAVASGERLPLRGTARGRVDVRWMGQDIRSAEGKVDLTFSGDALRTEAEAGAGVDGVLRLTAANRRLRVEDTSVQIGASRIEARGEIGWDRTGTLDVSLESSDAAELQSLAMRFAEGLDTAALGDLVAFIRRHEVRLGDGLRFDGQVTGALNHPAVRGRFALDTVRVGEEALGRLTGELAYDPNSLQVLDGRLEQAGGGRAEFTFNYPFSVENGASLSARLDRVALGPLAHLVTTAPLGGEVSGTAELAGLPRAMRGTADVRVVNARYGDQSFEELKGRLALSGTRVESEDLQLRLGRGTIAGAGFYDTETRGYQVRLRGTGLDLADLLKTGRGIEIDLEGVVDVALEAESGRLEPGGERPRFFDRLTGTIAARDLSYRNEALGTANLSVEGRDSLARFGIKSELLGKAYSGEGQIDFSRPEAPATGLLNFQDVPLPPIIALLTGREVRGTGEADGQLRLAGNLFGERDKIRIEAEFSELFIGPPDIRLSAQPPVRVTIAGRQVEFRDVNITGRGATIKVDGSFAWGEGGKMGLTLNGDLDLSALQSFLPDIDASGVARVQISASGTPQQPRLTGSATIRDGALRMRDFPITVANANGRILFNADQAQIESLTAEVNNGRASLSGGAAFSGLQLDRWRIVARVDDVRLEYPRDVRNVADGELTLQGSRQLQVLSGILNVQRTEYLGGGDLFDLYERFGSEFGSSGGAFGGSSLLPPTALDLRVVANNSLTLKTDTLDVVASADLRLTGPAEDPVLRGRMTITRGIIDNVLRDRYRIVSGVIEFPGATAQSPRINFEAETDISGYRVSLLVTGTFDSVRITPRSEPPLPQTDVITLLTTGQLPRDGFTGTSASQSLAQTQPANLATLLTQPLSSRIESTVTGRLFGLNRFSIDPLMTGSGTDPTARVTVGRRITKDLSITYSANLATNQDQLILIEYRASDRLSFVASRSQDGSFGIDVRLRKRF